MQNRRPESLPSAGGVVAEQNRQIMFTYLNPDVRKRLIAEGKLVRLDAQGQLIDVATPESPGELAINLLGPIPLPLNLPGVETTVQWYAAVRSTELKQVEALAADLRARGGQHLFSHLVSPLAVNSVLVVGEPSDNPLVRVPQTVLPVMSSVPSVVNVARN